VAHCGNNGSAPYVSSNVPTSVRRFLKWETDTHQLSTWVYSHLPSNDQIIWRTHFWYISIVFKKNKVVNELAKEPLILSCKLLLLWGFWNNQNWWFFENSRNCSTLVPTGSNNN
jgi:hypothetical protein